MTTKEYKREWYLKNHEAEKQRSRDRAQARRQRRRNLLAPFSCFTCGDPDDTVIQWHHVEEDSKSFHIFGGSSSFSEDAWWNEVLKCIPLCANCHLKLHKQKLCLLKPEW